MLASGLGIVQRVTTWYEKEIPDGFMGGKNVKK